MERSGGEPAARGVLRRRRGPTGGLTLADVSADKAVVARAADASEKKVWEEWYRLARYALACRHEEAVQYANLRFVEEQNRAFLRRGNDGRGSLKPS